MTTVLKGATRCVLLTERWAIKFPRLCEWRLFLSGLLANLQEREWGKASLEGLCPVLFSLPGGWLVVMPKCSPVGVEWSDVEWDRWQIRDGYRIPCERKMDSLGILGGEIVAIDFG